MLISELITNLLEIQNEHGNCEVFYWDTYNLRYNPIFSIIYQDDSKFKKDLADCQEYIEDFELTKNNVVLI